jgi:hypothetical protein
MRTARRSGRYRAALIAAARAALGRGSQSQRGFEAGADGQRSGRWRPLAPATRLESSTAHYVASSRRD